LTRTYCTSTPLEVLVGGAEIVLVTDTRFYNRMTLFAASDAFV